MAVLTIVSEPPKFQSAYKPLLVGLTSMRSPNSMPGESAIIASIHEATALDVTNLGNGLVVGDLMVTHGALFGVLVAGQTVSVDSDPYDGVFRVLKVISNAVTVIDGEYLEDTTGGRIAKFYDNYTIVAEVTMENAEDAIRYDLELNSDDQFVLDASDAAQRTFADVFEIAKGGDPLEFIIANRYITQQWSVRFSEAYMIPDANGINVFTELDKQGAVVSLSGKVAVNSVQPYHHIDEEDGSPDLQWMEDLENYQINDASGTDRKFLTYAPRGGTTTYDQRTALRVGSDDDFFLAILHATGIGTRLDLRTVFFNAQGGIVGQIDQDYSITDADSFLFNVGPNAFTVPSGTHHYYVELNNTPVGSYSERFHITIDQQCNTSARFFFLNSFGAIDQYTIENPELRDNGVKRFTVEKPNMALNLATRRGDHQRRTYRVEITRSYSSTTRKESKPVLRWIGDELLPSTDVRVVKYDNAETIYTRVIMSTDDMKMGYLGGRATLQWEYGVDNQRQRR